MSAVRTSVLREVIGGGSLLTLAVGLALAGCQKPQEKVLDIEAPGVDIEVRKSPDEAAGKIDIEVPPDADH